jgi:hypothetical protein
MSKGSAGKVYFVLYLAVILELLIIIVERDEAEESLHKRQKESMRIVQNILSQLQTGSGSSNMNVSPNDLIIIQDKGTLEALPKDQRIKRQKTYSVKVSVTDVSGAKKPAGTEVSEEEEKRDVSLTKLGNVQDLTYQLFFCEVRKDEIQESAPLMPTDEDFKKEKGKRISDLKKGDIVTNKEGKAWQLMDVRRLELDVVKTKERNVGDGWRKPVYSLYLNDQKILDEVPDPPNLKDTVFYYDHKRTLEDRGKTADSSLKTRSFTVNFDPGEDGKPGWYKLRFFSSTNRILGIDGGINRDLKDEDQVNVGVVKLKVKALRAVKRELLKDLDGKLEIRDSWYNGEGGVIGLSRAVDEFNSVIANAKKTYAGNDELIEKITLYDYIEKLLTPGFSAYLDQNRGIMDIDVEVRKPDANQAPPQVSDIPQTDNKNMTITYDKLNVTKIRFKVRPASYFKPGNPNVEIKPSISGWRIEPVQGSLAQNAPAPEGGAANQPKELYLIFDKPVPAGDYNIKFSYAGAGKVDTTSMLLRVLPSKLDDRSEKALQNLKGFFGKRLTFRSNFRPDAILPLNQYAISYQLGNAPPVPDEQYNPVFNGPIIPASAKKVKASIVWKYPETGERVTIWSKDIDPVQTPPDIVLQGPSVEKKTENTVKKSVSKSKKPVQPDGFTIVIKGVVVEYDVPVDVDPKNPNSPKRATADNVEQVGEAEIDFTSDETKLVVYNGDEPDPTATWQANASNFSLVNATFAEGAFTLTINVKDLPPKPASEQRRLYGQIAVKAGARIKYGSNISQNVQSTVVIPNVSIVYQ